MNVLRFVTPAERSKTSAQRAVNVNEFNVDWDDDPTHVGVVHEVTEVPGVGLIWLWYTPSELSDYALVPAGTTFDDLFACFAEHYAAQCDLRA